MDVFKDVFFAQFFIFAIAGIFLCIVLPELMIALIKNILKHFGKQTDL